MLKEFGKSEEFQKILESTHRIFLENKKEGTSPDTGITDEQGRM